MFTELRNIDIFLLLSNQSLIRTYFKTLLFFVFMRYPNLESLVHSCLLKTVMSQEHVFAVSNSVNNLYFSSAVQFSVHGAIFGLPVYVPCPLVMSDVWHCATDCWNTLRTPTSCQFSSSLRARALTTRPSCNSRRERLKLVAPSTPSLSRYVLPHHRPSCLWSIKETLLQVPWSEPLYTVPVVPDIF